MSLTYEEVRAQRIAESKAEGERYRALSEQVSSEANGAWALVSDPALVKAISQAARRVNHAYPDVLSAEDLTQEAWIILATRLFERAQECLAGLDGATVGTLQHELEMDLVDLIRPIARRHGQRVSLDALLDKGVEI
jgi:hypothetical protein